MKLSSYKNGNKKIVMCGDYIFVDKMKEVKKSIELAGHEVLGIAIDAESMYEGGERFEDLILMNGGIDIIQPNNPAWQKEVW